MRQNVLEKIWPTCCWWMDNRQIPGLTDSGSIQAEPKNVKGNAGSSFFMTWEMRKCTCFVQDKWIKTTEFNNDSHQTCGWVAWRVLFIKEVTPTHVVMKDMWTWLSSMGLVLKVNKSSVSSLAGIHSTCSRFRKGLEKLLCAKILVQQPFWIKLLKY